MVPRRGRLDRVAVSLAVALLAAAVLAVPMSAPARGQIVPGYGAGVFPVSGTANAGFSLADGGTYFLIVATDDASDFVNASLAYNGSLAAELNETGSAATQVSLPAGDYILNLTGHGRAALGWDLTNGSGRDFPDNRTVAGFLRPASSHVKVAVLMGNAQEIHLAMYDDRLLLVNETNVTTSRNVGVDLPASHATSALLVASVIAGDPQGFFGLGWSSPSPNLPGPDLASQILTAFLWIAVPAVIALLAFVLLQRRRRRMP